MMTKTENKPKTKYSLHILFAESKRVFCIIFLLAVLIGVIILAGAAAGYGVHSLVNHWQNQ